MNSDLFLEWADLRSEPKTGEKNFEPINNQV